MHIVVTGANGFVGKALIKRLVFDQKLNGKAISEITALDLQFDRDDHFCAFLQQKSGDISNPLWLRSALQGGPIDVVFHLASIPGGMAQQQYDLARNVNIGATTTLLERCKDQVEAGNTVAKYIFASSIAVFGQMSDLVDDQTALRPQMTYGAQKVIGEVLINDFSRRGWIDGYALRLPGVLARPKVNTGQMSAFLSNIFHDLVAGHPFICPMTPRATTWASSLGCVIDNLLQCARITPDDIGTERSLTLPTLCFTMQELVDAISAVYDVDGETLVRFIPDEKIETLFGKFPPLITKKADQLGFKHDGDIETLVRRALSGD